MSKRFFVSEPVGGPSVSLAGSEAHHLAHVMRAKPGDEVTLFDGTGSEFSARVDELGRSQVKLTILSSQSVDRENPLRCTLAVALPKGERQSWLVEKAVELGVARLVPLVTTRGVAQPGPQALERLRRTAIEAAKQCGRNRLLEIGEPQRAAECFAAAPSADQRFIAALGAELPLGRVLDEPISGEQAGHFAIGPEGGFTNEEIEAALAVGWRAVNLGPRILRVETAALLAASAWAIRSANNMKGFTTEAQSHREEQSKEER